MDSKGQIISKALLELEQESKKIKTEQDYRLLTRKFGIVFFGNNANVIYSQELAYCLKEHFSLEVSHDELIDVLPDLCKSLGMGCESMKLASNLAAERPAMYQITLRE